MNAVIMHVSQHIIL